MKVLLTGATGLLGSYIVKLWRGDGMLFGTHIGNYTVTDNEKVKYRIVDIRDREGMEDIFVMHNIDVVIHTAGEARVDFCQKNYEDACSTNVIGTKTIINLCRKYKSRLVYISTNAIFDGTNPLYKEDDAPNPINCYGKIKLECENLVREAISSSLIIRPILMYGWNRSEERDNVATWILKRLQNNEEIKLVNDIFDNPLYAGQCADCVLKLIEKNKNGVYHIAGSEILSRYEFGLVVADVFGCNRDLISAVKNEYFKEIAPRPKNTSYDTRKIKYELGTKELLTVSEGLLQMFINKRIFNEKSTV